MVFVTNSGEQVLAAAPRCKAAEVMVEGETLLVLLLVCALPARRFAREPITSRRAS